MKPMHKRVAARMRGRHTAERGVSMLFALMALVALSLAAISLVRSVDTGALIMGNLSFKEDTLLASEEAIRQAVAGVAAGGSGEGHFETVPPNLDVTGSSKATNRVLIDWNLDGCKEFKSSTYAECRKPVPTRIELPNGMWARYITFKLCSSSGPGADCLSPLNQVKAESSRERGEIKRTEDYRTRGLASSSFTQIIVRTEGTRGAVSYVEALSHGS